MKRGHAEALMPLIARVMKAVRHWLRRARPHRGDHRPRQLYRPAGRPLRRARHRAGRRQAGGRADHADRLCRARRQRERRAPIISAIDARHDHVYFQVVSGDGGRADAAARRADRRGARASRFGAPHLVGNAANILADRWPADAPPPFKVDPQPAPDIAWVAWLGAAVSPDAAPARPLYLRAPDAKPPKDPLQKAAQPSRHDGMALRLVERRRPPWSSPRACAMRRGSRSFTAPRFIAAGAKANSRPC